MPLIYLDQNALIKLGFKALGSAEFRAKLDSAIQSGAFKVVVSSWHLIETANTNKLENATKLADFIDSLKPAWLFERRDIQTFDVQEDFFNFAKLEYQPKPRIGTHSAVTAALNGQKDAEKFDIPSRKFVEQWIEHPEQLAALKTSYVRGIQALLGLRKAVKEGKITPEIEKRTNQELLKGLVPKFTPQGLEIPNSTIREYIDRSDLDPIPTLAIERAISGHEWNTDGGADRNTMIDKFHLIPALAYVDEIVSDDDFFHEIHPVAAKTGHVRAKVLRFEEFVQRFA